MNTANGRNSRTRPARRVTAAKGDPQTSAAGRRAAGRTPAPTRGHTKLASAARAFNFDFRSKTVLDIGSSTGGFTEYALSRGAQKVIAVEKGTNQMKSPLKGDPRVELHEKTDIFNFKCTPDIILADVSFTPLTKVLMYARMNLARSNTDFLVMLKPQFETDNPNDLNRGIVKNETIRRKIIKTFEQSLKQNGFLIVKKHDNDLQGKHGNKERFYWLKLSS